VIARTQDKGAHGTIHTLVIEGKNHVRLTSPAFDVIRVGRPIAEGKIPGITADSLRRSNEKLAKLTLCVDHINRIVVAARNDVLPALRSTLAELEADLRTINNPL
jgi:hypothetical protein